MRVTMFVRCLAMMRGGGETRHLAWARELAALGVEVEIITGVPLVSGEARYPIDGAGVALVRSPYTRDFVYRCQHRRGFGVPLRRWFHEQMIGWAREILLDARSRQRGWTRTSEVAALLRQHESGSRDHAKRIWALVSLELWARTHLDRLHARERACA